jgi:serine protease Do
VRKAAVEIRTSRGGGTGIIWGEGGLIITNAHCAPSGVALRIHASGRSYDGETVAHARDHDLALIVAPSAKGQRLELRDARTLRVGELVFAHGHPLGISDSLAMGVVHAVARHPRSGEPKFVIADIRLAPGNSGGPLVDADGRLVGVNSMIMNGLGVAVPAFAVQRFVERARAGRAA